MRSVFFLVFVAVSSLNGVFGQVDESIAEKNTQHLKQEFRDTLNLDEAEELVVKNLDESLMATGDDLANVKVFSLNGQLVKNLSLKKPEEICEIEGLLKGSYWVTFSNREGAIATKLEVE